VLLTTLFDTISLKGGEKMDFLTSENAINLFKFIGKVIAAIGIFTIVQGILYLKIGKDFESITVKRFPDETQISDIYKEGFDVLRDIDLDPDNKGTDHRYTLIGPEDKEMTKIKFLELDQKGMDRGKFIYNEINLDEYAIKSLKPQQYLLVGTPTGSNIPTNKISFNIDYQPGEYEFSSNMRSGLNDKVTLEVKRTIMSFLANL
jgi:hypothetical protein